MEYIVTLENTLGQGRSSTTLGHSGRECCIRTQQDYSSDNRCTKTKAKAH